MRLGWRFSWLPSLGLISFLCRPEGGLGPGKVPWPGDFGTTAKEGGGNGASEERPRENGDALTWEGSLGPLPGPSAQPHKGEWSMHSCVLHINSPPASHTSLRPVGVLLPPAPHGAHLWPTGILKKKCLPTISEKSSLLRLPPEQGTTSPRGSSASEGSRGGLPPRPPPRQSLQEQLNGVMPIAMSIKAGTVDEDSSGSE